MSASSWKLEDAKARFSEVVRLAHEQGPQAVTVRGRRAVVILDADEYDRLAKPVPATSFVEFMQGLTLDDLGGDRPVDTGRDVEL